MILAVEGGSTASCMGLHSRHETTTSIISKSTLLHMDITKNHSSLFVAYTELCCLQRTTYCSQPLRGSMRRQTVTLLVGAPFCRPFLLSPMFLVRLPNVLINRFQRSAVRQVARRNTTDVAASLPTKKPWISYMGYQSLAHVQSFEARFCLSAKALLHPPWSADYLSAQTRAGVMASALH
ncbi:hypothetical protein CI102_13106 [Trichoderma harzianum]|nr:hypothetical protein CI102_13106 [Trichoderma harzianum]